MFMQISEMKKEIQQIFFDFQIASFEFVALDTRFCSERILVIGFKYVNKHA